jgi:hypothetical protein
MSSEQDEASGPDRPDAGGQELAGTDPAGTDPAGTDPAGTDPAGQDLAGTDPTGADPTGAGTARPQPMTGVTGPGPATAIGPAGQYGPDAQQSGTAPTAGRLGGKLPWKTTDDGRTVFRRGVPFVFWWLWVIFLVFNLVQVIIPDHDYFSLELAAGLLAVTAIVYACALRPRVVSDEAGIAVRNPVQDHLIGWGGVKGVYLGDSVELNCARATPHKGKTEKTVYCWALYSGRRTRMKNQQLGVRSWGRGSARAPAEAHDLATLDSSQLMAAELGRRATRARQTGVPETALASSVAWLPVVLIVAPTLAFIGLLLAQ